MKFHHIAIFSSAIFLTACQPNPIVAPEVDAAKYTNLSCTELNSTLEQFRSQTAQLNVEKEPLEEQRRAGIAVGVVLSPLGGALIGQDATEQIRDIDTKIAALTAEQNAVIIAGRTKGCWN